MKLSLSFSIIPLIIARYQTFEITIPRSIASSNHQFRRVVILTNSRNIVMSRTAKEKAVENEGLELNAKKIMKFLLDHEVHLPSTYDSEKKIINLCVKNLVRLFFNHTTQYIKLPFRKPMILTSNRPKVLSWKDIKNLSKRRNRVARGLRILFLAVL